jgi:hypothetical protein
MSAGRRAALLALTLAVGCRESEERPDGRNRCTTNADCDDQGQCHLALGICIATAVSEPYEVALQVNDLAHSPGTLPRYTFPPELLERSSDDKRLDIPPAVAVSGRVYRAVGDVNPVQDAVAAEVVFVSQVSQAGLVPSPITVASKPEFGPADQGNLQATLAPDREYEVTIYPVGDDSLRLPPAHTHFKSSANGKFEYQYGALEPLTAVLVDDQDNPQPGVWLRVHAGTYTGSGDDPSTALRASQRA